MANLNNWQKLNWVISRKPFGDGIDGNYSSAVAPSVTYRSCSGTSGSTDFTIESGAYSNGDVLFIYQTRGTGAGQWEVNKIVSGGGTTALSLLKPLQYTYTDSLSSQAQCINIKRYNNVTAQAGTWSVQDWDGNTGGILPIAVRTLFTVTGTLESNGSNGSVQSGVSYADIAGATGGGFRGGTGRVRQNTPNTGTQGEGTNGDNSTESTSANGNGGGAGSGPQTHAGAAGGGGANGGSGTSGGGANPGAVGGTGGSTAGSADLTNFVFGGGGGGAGQDTSGTGNSGSGASGGGAIVIFAKEVVVTGGIQTTGGTGGIGQDGAHHGGDGAGGSILLILNRGTLGTNLVVATPGSGGTAAGTGRIAVHHSGTVTGTTNPTFTDVSDTSLKEMSGMAQQVG